MEELLVVAIGIVGFIFAVFWLCFPLIVYGKLKDIEKATIQGNETMEKTHALFEKLYQAKVDSQRGTS